jgi:hypothetical protein
MSIHALHLLEFGLPYIKDHFDSVAGRRELETSHEKLSERLLVFETVNIETPSLMPPNVNTRKISLRQMDRCFIQGAADRSRAKSSHVGAQRAGLRLRYMRAEKSADDSRSCSCPSNAHDERRVFRVRSILLLGRCRPRSCI